MELISDILMAPHWWSSPLELLLLLEQDRPKSYLLLLALKATFKYFLTLSLSFGNLLELLVVAVITARPLYYRSTRQLWQAISRCAFKLFFFTGSFIPFLVGSSADGRV